MTQYHTDGIDSFVSLHGFAEAVRIVAKALGISQEEAKMRIEFAQSNHKNEI